MPYIDEAIKELGKGIGSQDIRSLQIMYYIKILYGYINYALCLV